jgi:hypothetical protein
MAGLGQIAFLGGGGLSGLAAAGLISVLPGGLWGTLALLGGLGALLGLAELWQQRRLRLGPASLS